MDFCARSVLLLFAVLPLAYADVIPIGSAASNYGVLYEGTTANNLQIANVTITGSVGVGGTGVVQNNGPSTITGELDFSAASSGQYHNNNGSNVGPTSVNYNVAAVTNALTATGKSLRRLRASASARCA